MIQENGNNHPLVIATINKAIGLDADNQTALAVQLLTALAAEFPQAASVHSYLAWYFLRNSQLDEATEHGRQAVALSPKSEKASLIYFHVLWKSGQHVQALEEMKRFLTLRPSEEYINLIKEWKPSPA